MSLEFPNGARIIGLPGSEATIRGFSAVSLLLVDEAARVSDDLYKAIRPMLAVSAGELWLMSTPFGKGSVAKTTLPATALINQRDFFGCKS